MRYIRFTFTDYDVFQELRVAEIEVYDTSNGEVASGVPVVASSEETENEFLPASNVNDGDTNTEWSIAAGAWPVAWIYFDLGSSLTELQKYRLFLLSTQIGPTAWTVETADNPAGPWTLVENRVQDPPTYNAWMEFIPPVAIVLAADSGRAGGIGAQPLGGADVALLAVSGRLGAVGPQARRGPTVAVESVPGVLGALGATAALPPIELQATAGEVGAVGETGFALLQPVAGSILTTVYKCTLEAADDPADFIVLPISSFQTRQRDSDPTWLQVVVPDVIDTEEAIAARADGILRVYQGTRDQHGNEVFNPLAWGYVDQYQIQIGANNSSAVIGSHGDEVTTAPKVWPLQDLSYRANQSGARRVRARPDQSLRPGDTATYSGGSFVVGLIQYAVSATTAQMEVIEQAA